MNYQGLFRFTIAVWHMFKNKIKSHYIKLSAYENHKRSAHLNLNLISWDLNRGWKLSESTPLFQRRILLAGHQQKKQVRHKIAALTKVYKGMLMLSFCYQLSKAERPLDKGYFMFTCCHFSCFKIPSNGGWWHQSQVSGSMQKFYIKQQLDVILTKIWFQVG